MLNDYFFPALCKELSICKFIVIIYYLEHDLQSTIITAVLVFFVRSLAR